MKLKVTICCIYTMICLLAFGLTQLKPGFAADMPSPSWRTKTSMPTSRGQAAVITGDDGLIYVMGGFVGADPPNATVEAYNLLTDKWTAKASMPFATRGAAVAKGSSGLVYLIGGVNGTEYLTTVQIYNATSNTWSTKAAIPTTAWMASAATADDGRICVFGGESLIPLYSNKTQIYDPSTEAWTSGADMPTARGLLGVVKASDGLIYCIGGYNGSVLSVVEAYDPSTDTWTEKASMPTPKLQFGLVLGPDEKIYVIGGGVNYTNNGRPFSDTVEIYDPRTDTWTAPSWSESFLSTARKELGAAVGNNGRIYAIGGANGTYVGANEEALIALPENIAPSAYIDSISPNPATRGQTISLVGHGSDCDGSAVAYEWRSSVDGTMSATASFNISSLSDGLHTVYFSVRDNSGVWSEEATAIIIVDKPVTEDPLYLEILSLNETMNERIGDLSQQNNDLLTKIDSLSQQNTNLTNKINNLGQRVDAVTLELLGASVVIIALLILPIAVKYVGKRLSTSILNRLL